jgi:hypothetical protein
MGFSAPYSLPGTPPVELLAQLDAAAEALDRLTARAAQLMLAIDERAVGRRIELHEADASRPLTPTQLFDLLTGAR